MMEITEKELNEKLKRMEIMGKKIEEELRSYKEEPEEVVKRALSKLSDEQINECIIMSGVIAAKKAGESIEETAYNAGRLSGYLHCLTEFEVIDWIEAKALKEWFAKEDRSL